MVTKHDLNCTQSIALDAQIQLRNNNCKCHQWMTVRSEANLAIHEVRIISGTRQSRPQIIVIQLEASKECS